MTTKRYVGTAGWAIRKEHAQAFPGAGSHLERYAQRLNCVEINSSFYRPHKPSTYARWAASVPDDFRFAVKMPREITHDRKLVDVAEPLDRFLNEIRTLGGKLGSVLVQLPPRLKYEQAIVAAFLADVRARFDGAVVCEPRHATWRSPGADEVLKRHRIARVAADPVVIPGGGEPAGWTGLIYRRLHGSPKVYYSAYSAQQVRDVARAMHETPAAEDWCIFDNTALGEATANALSLVDLLQET